MRPPRVSSSKNDLFRERLTAIINMKHPLVRLSELMPWDDSDAAFGRFYRPVGRPAKPTRLMVGLHYLKHVCDLSDEEVVGRWVETRIGNSSVASNSSSTKAPIDASTLTRWRERVGPEGLEALLKASVEVALETGTAKSGSPERVNVDTTVRPKAIAHPTDSLLYLQALQILVRQAKRHGIVLRQSRTRLAKAAAVRAGRYAHARQFRRMRRELKRLRTYLRRVFRDVGARWPGMPSWRPGSPGCSG
ncbi:transposase [Mesorhizobium sp. 1B3]|uniref:transposase n=1 Tax=Mesorhizobium sp. 1B3 TaxID=3243599 RepID=UPI003D96A267